MKILADGNLPLLDELFPPPFELTKYYSASDAQKKLNGQNVLICRSTLKVNADFIQNNHVDCVATASSGTDHIDTTILNQRQIILFDAKGANASAVADYVIATLAWLSQTGLGNGNTAGIIGMGYVGKAVYKVLRKLNYEVICYDPYLANIDSKFPWVNIKQLYDCDLICIHPNLHSDQPFPSLNLINSDFIQKLSAQTILINASRGGVVSESAILKSKLPLIYCTDVYQNEPQISKQIVDLATLCTPHIAGHSIEAKTKAVIKLSKQIHEYYGMPFIIKSNTNNSIARSGSKVNFERSWQRKILACYNPFIETQELKTSNNVTETFLNLRAAHTFRHDFNLEL